MKFNLLPCRYIRDKKGRVKRSEPLLENGIICNSFAEAEQKVTEFNEKISKVYNLDDVFFNINLCN